jgi:hypothetical protein
MNSNQSHKSCRKYKPEKGANMDVWIYQRWDQVPKSLDTHFLLYTERIW